MITWFRTLLLAKKTERDQEYCSYCTWFFYDDGTASNIRLSKPTSKIKPSSSASVLTQLDAQKTKS